jgi:hypothetical protein
MSFETQRSRSSPLFPKTCTAIAFGSAERSNLLFRMRRTREGELGDTIVRLFVDGYFNGSPSRVQVRFWHESQDLKPHDIIAEGAISGLLLTEGSVVVAHLLLETDDARYARYRYRMTESKLGPAARFALSYILACSDPVSREVDELCVGTGGKPQIATVTPNQGFRWASKWEPESLLPGIL